MSTLYPSRDTPGPPSVAVDVPEGTALAARLPRVEAEGNPVA